MILKPDELATEERYGPTSSRGCDIWDTIIASEEGDVDALRSLLSKDPELVRSEYWYTQPLHFAVRSGRLEAVELLLDAGADPSSGGVVGEDLITTARDRGHESVAQRLEAARERVGRIEPEAKEDDSEIHKAAAAGDVDRVRALLDEDPALVHAADRAGGTPLHRAVTASRPEVVTLLLDRGADIHAVHGAGPGSSSGYAPVDFQAIDLALWSGTFWGVKADVDMACLLLRRGATKDFVIASALGDIDSVSAMLDEDPQRIQEQRRTGKRALSSAVEMGQREVVEWLLERGADPTWSDGLNAPQGTSLHAASRMGQLDLVDLLLKHGADPNSGIDSSGSATYIAGSREVRQRLLDAGGRLDVFDLIWLDEDDEALRRVAEDPSLANGGCGGVFAATCRLGKSELLAKMLDAGARVPPMMTGCRTYLLTDPDMLQMLLDSGMDPNLPSWQRATLLHDACGVDSRNRPHARRVDCASVLLDGGASMTLRDEEYRSTPLAWAARCGLLDMVELLLQRGSPTELPDDESWATPLSWATRRNHAEVVAVLRNAGAKS